MKKVILVLALGATTLASCSKSQTCTCDVITSDGGITPVQHSVINTSKQTKRQARKGICASYSEKVDGVSVLHNCKID